MGSSIRSGYEAEERLRDSELRAAMRELIGQFATPSWLRERARTLEAEGLMKFREWPSGHWSLTDKGRNFLADSAG